MKILITGATGFVGRNLMPKIIEGGHDILAIVIDPELFQKLYGSSADYYHYNSDNHNGLVNKISIFQPEIVIHLASYITSSDSFQDLSMLIKANIVFLTEILDALKQSPPELFINTGTFAEYFSNDMELDPAYLYSAAKTAARSFLKYYSEAYNFKFLNVIPFSIYGPNDSQKKLMDYLIDAIESPIPVDFTAGEQILDFIHVDDVAEAYIALLKNHNPLVNNEIFFVGTGKGISIRELAGMIEKISCKKLNINWGGRKYRKRDIMNAVAPLKNNNSNIGWKPCIDINSGIRDKLKEIK